MKYSLLFILLLFPLSIMGQDMEYQYEKYGLKLGCEPTTKSFESPLFVKVSNDKISISSDFPIKFVVKQVFCKKLSYIYSGKGYFGDIVYDDIVIYSTYDLQKNATIKDINSNNGDSFSNKYFLHIILNLIDDKEEKVDQKTITLYIKPNLVQSIEIKPFAQSSTLEEFDNENIIPFSMVEVKPMFQGIVDNDFSKWVHSNIVIPEMAKENGIQGRVIVSFIINTDGNVSDVKVLRGVSPVIDKEAIRIIQSSPKWTPGRNKGKIVRVQYSLPVLFQLK